MPVARQTFVNENDSPIYISIEPSPECYELEPGERLTLIYDQPKRGDALVIDVRGNELIIWPNEFEPEPVVLINGANAKERNWKFKHHPG